jgi:catechol 2,3-dioxygenase-like lactoylglutathione lyase family enzyme
VSTAKTGRREFIKRSALAGAGATAMRGLLSGRADAAAGAVPRHESHSDKPLAGEMSLGGNITKVLFLTINVSDLDRAIEFYEATYPVKRAEELNGPAQAFHGFGISHGRFRGRMMRDSQPFQGSAILLVQWLSPGPVGKPYPEANHLGWYREHANASQTGMNSRYEVALNNGGRPYGPPSKIFITPTEAIMSFGFRDPDGTTLEWVGPVDPTPGGQPDSVAGPNNNCLNLPRSYRWYRDVLGLELSTRLNPNKSQPFGTGSLGDSIRKPDGSAYTGPTDFDAAIMVPRGDSRNSVDLLQWQQPGSFGRPFKHANNLGMINLTYEVNSVQVVYEKLLRVLPDPRKHVVAPPETWDLGDYGVKKTLNILDPDGTMFQFIEMAHSKDPQPS